jgi:ribosome-associated toxin RatA of RatAB toxin-antitoxin module
MGTGRDPALDMYTSRPWRELAAGASRHSRLGAMPVGRASETLDERLVRAPLQDIFDVARLVEHWPAYLPHYRFVRVREGSGEDDMLVEMSANRPFGVANWPTWWLSEMTVQHHGEAGAALPTIRFRHVRGVTAGMEVEWSFIPEAGGTRVRILHAWDGPRWPIIGLFAATTVIGPVFVHGIATRTLEGLARVAERGEAKALARATGAPP